MRVMCLGPLCHPVEWASYCPVLSQQLLGSTHGLGPGAFLPWHRVPHTVLLSVIFVTGPWGQHYTTFCHSGLLGSLCVGKIGGPVLTDVNILPPGVLVSREKLREHLIAEPRAEDMR